MTQEKVAEFKAYLERKVEFWKDAGENYPSIVGASRLQTYQFALCKFEHLSADPEQKPEQKPEPTESLHEMAKRLCVGRSCDICPIHKQTGADNVLDSCVIECLTDPDVAEADAQISALRAWAAENPPKPVKTYRDDFFEKFPGAQRDHEGTAVLSVGMYYKLVISRLEEYALTSKRDGWDKPLGYWEA